MPEFLKTVGAARFGVMAGVAAVLTAFFLYIAGAITEPPKTILFSGLESRDAAAVTGKLDGMAVKYDVKDGGTILVPADQVTKLRMALAQDNLPAAGVGYEIFDKSDAFGTTAFVQNINHQRALEGELSRSMQTIEGIQAARVHLVVPEQQVFARNEQQPSASVVLKTAGKLDRGQVQAIQHLVAAAVSGLSADRVAIVDDRGNLLAGGDDKSGPDALARNQDEDTTNYENRLRQRVEAIVTSVVGHGPCPGPGRGRHQLQPHPDHQRNPTIRTVQGGALDPDGGAECRQHQRRPARPCRSPMPCRAAAPPPAAMRPRTRRAAPRKPPITKSPRRSRPPRSMAATSRSCRSRSWWTARATPPPPTSRAAPTKWPRSPRW